jgi:hypothetical protein
LVSSFAFVLPDEDSSIGDKDVKRTGTAYNQVDLFEIGTRYLHVLQDGDPADLSLQAIFDHTAFQELKAVTFVSSTGFFFDIAKDFKRVELVIGIQEGNVLDSFGLALDPEREAKEWNQLTPEIRQRILDGSIAVRRGKPNVLIHSKIFLLSGTGGTRVVLGSANLTESAFKGKHQFEEVLIFSGRSWYDLYNARVEEIKEHTDPFPSSELLEKAKDEAPNQYFMLDPDTTVRVLQEQLGRNADLVVPEDISARLKVAPQEAYERRVESEKLVALASAITKIDKDGKTSRISSPKRNDQKFKLRVLPIFQNKANAKGDVQDTRPPLIYDDVTEQLMIKTDNLISGMEELVPFSRHANTEQIAFSLKTIDRFVEAYYLFTTRNDPKTRSRVFEAILYAFSAPYFWKMRELIKAEQIGDVLDIQPFMVIGGAARSGKTKLLEFINRLLGGRDVLSHELIKKQNSRNQMLYNMFESNIIFPVLLDEIEDGFFRKEGAVKMVKWVANDLAGQKHPVLIGATNADEFAATHQVQRRIIYLQVNDPFKDDLDNKRESREYFNDNICEVTDALFRDFTCRLYDLIKSGDFYSIIDPLVAARRIFKDYYQEAGLELPPWFPHIPMQNLQDTGRTIWGGLYRSRREAFVDQGDSTFLVNQDQVKDFIANTSRDRNLYLADFLPLECVKNRAGVLAIWKDPFLAFINSDGGPKKNLLRRIASFFNHNSILTGR